MSVLNKVIKMGFITKDSGKRVEFKSGMRRDTQEGKPRYDLLIAKGQKDHLIKRWAELMGRGMDKYGYRNWELANSEEELLRFEASAWRHFMQAMNGEVDEDHFAAVCYNLNAILFLREKLDNQIKDNKDKK